jgi:hypothetical protein
MRAGVRVRVRVRARARARARARVRVRARARAGARARARAGARARARAGAMARARARARVRMVLVRSVDARLVLGQHERAQLVEVVAEAVEDGRVAEETAVRDAPHLTPLAGGSGLERSQRRAVEA